MDYITIVAPTYEDAVRKARDQYGDRLRIHSRKDVVSRGFLGIRKGRHCELTCFLAGEAQTARTQPSPVKVSSKDEPSKASSVDASDSLGLTSQNDDERIGEDDIRRFELEAKTPDPVSGKYRESDMQETVEDSVTPSSNEGEGGVGASDDASVQPAPFVQAVQSVQRMGADASYGASEPSQDGLFASEEASVYGSDGGLRQADDGAKALDALLDYARRLLYENDFSSDYIDWITGDLRAQLEPVLPALPSKDEFELLVVDRIVGSVEIDHNSQLHPPRLFVLVGPTGVGKTTTIAKIAAVYGTLPPEGIRRNVSIITMDSFRVGAYEQMENFGKALGVPVYRADDETGFYEALEKTHDSDLVLVDTIGKSPKDGELDVKMRTMLNVPDRKNFRCYLTVSASMKRGDLDGVFEQFSGFGICSVIVTKTDETQTIGNILSMCHSRKLPLLFITDGQKVPRDIHKASSAFMLSLLKGFDMDFNALWNTQIGSDE